jgi:N-acetylmuramoyl-L-alanine amidase
MYKIYIDAGHGGTDAGAIGVGGIKEADINLTAAKYLDAELKRHGISTKMCRTTNATKSLADRAAEANKWGATYICSLHCNAYDNMIANGTETLIYKKGGTAEKLAIKVQAELVSAFKTANRGVKERPDLYILRKTTAPAILCEIAFITNNADKAKVDEAAEQKAVAVAICKGICSYLGIAYKKEEINVNKTKFKDESKMSSWAIDSIKYVSDKGIMNGDTNGKFNPKKNLTREEAAVIVKKILEKHI